VPHTCEKGRKALQYFSPHLERTDFEHRQSQLSYVTRCVFTLSKYILNTVVQTVNRLAILGTTGSILDSNRHFTQLLSPPIQNVLGSCTGESGQFTHSPHAVSRCACCSMPSVRLSGTTLSSFHY